MLVEFFLRDAELHRLAVGLHHHVERLEGVGDADRCGDLAAPDFGDGGGAGIANARGGLAGGFVEARQAARDDAGGELFNQHAATFGLGVGAFGIGLEPAQHQVGVGGAGCGDDRDIGRCRLDRDRLRVLAGLATTAPVLEGAGDGGGHLVDADVADDDQRGALGPIEGVVEAADGRGRHRLDDVAQADGRAAIGMIAKLELQEGLAGFQRRAGARAFLGQHDAAFGVDLVGLDQHRGDQFAHHAEAGVEGDLVVAREIDDEGGGVGTGGGVDVGCHLQADALEGALDFAVGIFRGATEGEVFEEVGDALLARTLLHRAGVDQQTHGDLTRRRAVRQDDIAHAVGQLAELVVGIVREIPAVTRPAAMFDGGLSDADGLALGGVLGGGDQRGGAEAQRERKAAQRQGQVFQQSHHSSGNYPLFARSFRFPEAMARVFGCGDGALLSRPEAGLDFAGDFLRRDGAEALDHPALQGLDFWLDGVVGAKAHDHPVVLQEPALALPNEGQVPDHLGRYGQFHDHCEMAGKLVPVAEDE